jgi:hypothetical protein
MTFVDGRLVISVSAHAFPRNNDRSLRTVCHCGVGRLIRDTPQGLGVEEERALLATFDFDTPIVELEKNQHALKPLGMQKLPGTLTWKLQADSPDATCCRDSRAVCHRLPTRR